MPTVDPYRPHPPFEYECVACSNRVRAEHHPGTCPNCSDVMRDVSVPRE